MKTDALGWRGALAGLAGCALVVGVAAASRSNAQAAQATPLTDTARATDSRKNVSDPTANQQQPQRAGQVATAVSSQIAEIVKMTESGVGTAVIQAQVEQSATAYPPNADEIIYLHNHSVAPDVITAFIRRGSELRTQAEQMAQASQNRAAQPAPPTPAPAPAVVPPPTYSYPAQAEYPVYSYPYPNYVYAGYPGYGYYSYYNYGWPSYSLSFGFSPSRFGRFHDRFPRQFHGPVRSFPHTFAGSVRSPWVSPVRSGFGPPRHSGFAMRMGSGGRFGGGFSGPRSHR